MRAFAILTLLAACGDTAPEMTFATSIAWAPQIDCSAGEANLGLNMVATLEIGGHEACDLQVNPTTLEASGTCDSITIGIYRPLGLGYYYPDDPDEIPLAWIIGGVDLSKDILGNATNVPVSLSGDGVTSEQVDTNDEIAVLPEEEDCAAVSDENDRRLCISKAWAKDRLTERLTDFNIDAPADTDSNLFEACNNTLFD